MADVFGSNDIAIVFCSDARAIDTGAESRSSYPIDPRVYVSLLLGQHASALLLIQEDDGCTRESFAARGCSRGSRVKPANARGGSDRFQFSVEASVEEDEKAEAGRFDGCTLASPGVRPLARRIIEPVASVRESLVQGFQIGVAGIVIAVEAEERALCR